MDIEKAHEAFERRQAKVLNIPYEEVKTHFDENFRLFGARYNIGSINEKEWNLWLEAWQAKAVPEGFVLVPEESLKVALFWMDEDIDPWQMDGDSFADLFKHKPILEKVLIEAQELTND